MGCKHNQYYNYGSVESNLVIERYDNGEIKAKGAKIDGMRQGYWIEYWPSGVIYEEEVYVNDTLNGPSINYSNTGKICAKGSKKSGKREGNWELYYPNGNIQAKGNYFDGEIKGKWLIYNDDGSFKEMVNY
jgi:antitoxin component YwqK of YwqJK toxin-antitoxin module